MKTPQSIKDYISKEQTEGQEGAKRHERQRGETYENTYYHGYYNGYLTALYNLNLVITQLENKP